MLAKIKKILDAEIRPSLIRHGGDISLIGVEDNGVVTVRLLGQCAHCPGQQDTMRTLVLERLLKIEGVLDVRLDVSVSDELMEMARKLIKGRGDQHEGIDD